MLLRLLFLVAIGLLPVAASADPVADCDRLAANPYDPERVGAGVEFDAIDSAAAIVACLQAVEANPNEGRLAYQLGRAYDSGKNFPAAENAYLRAADLRYQTASRNLGYLYLDATDDIADPKKAERWFQRAAKSGDAVSMNELAWMWVVAGKNLRQASSYAQRAVEAAPEEADYRDTLGWAYFHLDRHEDAATEMEHAVRIAPEDASFRAHLGWIYDALGRTEEARAEWQRALDLPAPSAADDPTFDRTAIEEKLRQPS